MTSPKVFANASSISGRKPRSNFSTRRASSASPEISTLPGAAAIRHRGAGRTRADCPARRAGSDCRQPANAGRHAAGPLRPRSPARAACRSARCRCAGRPAHRVARASVRRGSARDSAPLRADGRAGPAADSVGALRTFPARQGETVAHCSPRPDSGARGSPYRLPVFESGASGVRTRQLRCCIRSRARCCDKRARPSAMLTRGA